MPDFVSKAEERRYNASLDQRKRDAYQDGYEYGRAGLSGGDCPYIDIILQSAWSRGHADGRASRLPKAHRASG